MTEQPNLNPENQQGDEASSQEEQPQQQQQPSAYQDLKQKKGFKSDDDVAKSYTEAEGELSRRGTVLDSVKQQLEAGGYEMDEKGQIKQKAAEGYPPHQQQQQQQQQEPVYDPYTGVPITDPITLQLLKLPPGQREAFIFNAMADQREKQSSSAFTNDQEILSRPEAKGFESDVRKVVMQMPLAQRADKKTWEDALLRVKGARYDTDKKNFGQTGVEEFINKEGAQLPAGQGGGAGADGGVRLTKEQEDQFQFYSKNHPGMFKNRAHFASRLNPEGV